MPEFSWRRKERRLASRTVTYGCGVKKLAVVLALPLLAALLAVPLAGTAGAGVVSVSSSKASVSDLGGTVTIHARVKKAKVCAWTSKPKVAGFDHTVKCAAKLSRAAKIPANHSEAGRRFVFSLKTRDGKLSASGTTVVTQAGRPAPTTTTTTTLPYGPFPGTESLNWAGFVLTGDTGSFQGASGEWTVPTLDCSAVPNGIVGDWVGVDGTSTTNPDLFQAGTISGCESGLQINAAWWTDQDENYEPMILFEPDPGDVISTEIAQSSSGNWSYTVDDVTADDSQTGTEAYSGPETSIEWIVEDPSNTSGALDPLGDFGSTTFSSLGVTLANGSWTVPPYSDATDIVNEKGTVLAVPSPMEGTTSAASFTVDYLPQHALSGTAGGGLRRYRATRVADLPHLLAPAGSR